MNKRIFTVLAAVLLAASPSRAATIVAGDYDLPWSAGPIAIPIYTIGDGVEGAFAVDLRLSIVGESPGPLIDSFSLDVPGALFAGAEYHTPFPDPNSPSPPAAEATGGAADFREASSPRVVPATQTLLALVNVDLSQVDAAQEGATWDWLLGNSLGPTAYSGTATVLVDGTLTVGPRNEWAGPGGSAWTMADNWTDGSVPNGVGAAANFLDTITGPSTVTLSSSVTAGTITFDSSQGYTIGGSATLTLDGFGGLTRINVLSGNHTISAPLAIPGGLVVDAQPTASLAVDLPALAVIASDLTKQGAGTWTITGGLALLGDVDVQEGILQIGTDLLTYPGGETSAWPLMRR